ncbi:unnamed protein product, partial [Hapterophycus canaliculatus]
MNRNWSLNESETFSAAIDANSNDLSAAAQFRRKEMCEAWQAVDKGRRELETRMEEVGIVEPSTPQHGVLRLNIGGSRVHVGRSVLRGEGVEGSSASRLSNLFESMWDNRVPRDSESYIVIDESPACVKHFIHKLLKRSGTAMGMAGLSFGEDLPLDQKAYVPHVSRVLGLNQDILDNSFAGELRSSEKAYRPHVSRVPGIGIAVAGGTKVLKPDQVVPLSSIVLGWCPGKPARMELIYRASRDGWTPVDFHSRCGDDSPSTVTMLRVSKGDGPGTTDSVVGGFSSISWSCSTTDGARYKASPGAFLFMLLNGTGSGSTFHPAKWGVQAGLAPFAVRPYHDWGPTFGEADLFFRYDNGSVRDLNTGNRTYNIPEESPFLRLKGLDVIEMEVFRVCAPGAAVAPLPPPALIKPNTGIFKAGLINLPASGATIMSAESYNFDIRAFGISTANSLLEERVALHQAHIELAQANAKAAASTEALEAVYGPHVAANEEAAATVVDLTVRGTRMTTLHSTLQACPDSAFAARFDEDKWPPTAKDVDEHGRRVVEDCSPSVFSKVLDVLRMRKRAAW